MKKINFNEYNENKKRVLNKIFGEQIKYLYVDDYFPIVKSERHYGKILFLIEKILKNYYNILAYDKTDEIINNRQITKYIVRFNPLKFKNMQLGSLEIELKFNITYLSEIFETLSKEDFEIYLQYSIDNDILKEFKRNIII